jgi:hypothetical protein
MFERFADSGVIGKLATPSESFQGMHPVESLNYVNEIAVNQGVSTLKCALALRWGRCLTRSLVTLVCRWKSSGPGKSLKIIFSVGIQVRAEP